QQATGNLPLILFGHSMGSFVARRYMQLYSEDISRVVLSGTGGNPGASGKMGLAVALASAKMQGKQQPSKTLGKMTFGSFNKPFGEHASARPCLSSLNETVAKSQSDPRFAFKSTTHHSLALL